VRRAEALWLKIIGVLLILLGLGEAFSPRYIPDGLVKALHAGTKWENVQLLPSVSQEGPSFTYVINRMIAFYQANAAQLCWCRHLGSHG
jgi:hypothetical protein